jgi:citrate lyase subunit beta/citryl-CoA lyase
MVEARMRARRSCLAVPGSEARFHAKANDSTADEIFLDLEDSVAPRVKAEARAAVVHALQTFRYAGKTKVVRVNATDSEWHVDDVAEVVAGAGALVDCLMLPKVESANEVRALDDRLTTLEREMGLSRAIGLELQIESARGLDRVSEIASASRRTETLVLGPGDLSASLRTPELTVGRLKNDYPGDFWHYFLARIVVAARANDLQPIDGPFGDISDLAGLREASRRSAMLGCDGKWAIHPSQVTVINEVFTPRQEDVDKANAILAVYASARDRDQVGALRVGDEMIDEASRKMAEVVMERAHTFGMSPRPWPPR